jgi:restriction endonuclease S subunit
MRDLKQRPGAAGIQLLSCLDKYSRAHSLCSCLNKLLEILMTFCAKKQVNKSKWSALTVALPPMLEEQKQIVAKLDALSEETQRLAAHYERKLELLGALKKSLLNEAFTGKL